MMFAIKKKKKKGGKNQILQVRQIWRFKNPRGRIDLPNRAMQVCDNGTLSRSFSFSMFAANRVNLHKNHYRIKRLILKKRKLKVFGAIVRRRLKTRMLRKRITPFWYRLKRKKYAKFFRRNRRYLYRGYTHVYAPITKKPLQLRMGKGKGEIKGWRSPIKEGQLLWQLGTGRHAGANYRVLTSLQSKLRRGCWFVTRDAWLKKMYCMLEYMRRFDLIFDPYYREAPRKAWMKKRREEKKRLLRGY